MDYYYASYLGAWSVYSSFYPIGLIQWFRDAGRGRQPKGCHKGSQKVKNERIRSVCWQREAIF